MRPTVAAGRAASRGAVITRRALFDSELFQIGHVVGRPVSSAVGDIEYQSSNVFVLPLAGVFAKHDGPRRHAIVTPDHAAFVAAGASYRVSFPGMIGDECVTLRLADAARSQALAAVAPGPVAVSAFASPVLLPAAALLARSLLWRRLASGACDRVEVEELGVGLLVSTLRAALRAGGTTPRERSDRRRRPVERVKEAVSVHPERRWTLGGLADIAAVSPYHLAHSFRQQVGTSVYKYLLRARLTRALDAVLDGDRDFTAIALDAGFASHSHFTARFRAFFGLTPGALRRAATPKRAAELRKIVTARKFAPA